MSVRGFNTGSGIEQYDYDYLDNKPDAPTKESIGLGNVDNTSDMNKPVSTAQAQALSQKVDKVPGMGLSSEDYTSADKDKLEALPTNAELEASLESKANQTEVTSLNQAINVLDGQVNDSTTGLDTKAPAIINTASGAIASFADGADSMPVKKLVVNVEPAQDLHGYDNPWPAGGGVNKFSPSLAATSSFDVSGEVYTSTLTDTRTSVMLAVQAFNDSAYVTGNTSSAVGTYPERTRVSITIESAVTRLRIKHNGSTQDLTIELPWTKQGTFTISLEIPKNDPTTVGGVVFQNIMITEDGTYTPFSPYSNECPISGWTGAEIDGGSKNFLDVSTATGMACTVSPDGTVTATIDDTKTQANFACQKYMNKTWIGQFNSIPAYPYTWKVIKDNTFNILRFGHSGSRADIKVNIDVSNVPDGEYLFSVNPISLTNKFSWNNMMLRLVSDTDATFEPFQSKEISVTFPSSAGTVYGATLTINPDRTGEMVVTNVIKTAPSVYSVGIASTGICYVSFDATQFPGKTPGTDIALICNKYKQVFSVLTPGNVGVRNVGTVYIYDDRFSGKSVQEATAMLSDLQIVYSLATPITYTLTESEISGILETLYGTNNIWADCGDTTVEYTAETKLFIEQLTQPTEDDMTANANIAANKFFMLNNQLYFSTAAIAQGATIIPGTNCNLVSLADALNQLNT